MKKLLSLRCMLLAISAFVVLAYPNLLVHAQCCIGPTTETSSVVNHYLITISAFQQTVSDSAGDNLNGLLVKEGTITPGTDGCWWSKSPYPPVSSVSGGIWTIGGPDPNGLSSNGTNQWGSDADGDLPGMVDMIRANATLPCTDHIPQTMYSQTTCNAAILQAYFFNIQTVTITESTVTNCRAGVCDVINF
jgi:hypothetical protein